jgi:hypothetical protein
LDEIGGGEGWGYKETAELETSLSQSRCSPLPLSLITRTFNEDKTKVFWKAKRLIPRYYLYGCFTLDIFMIYVLFCISAALAQYYVSPRN